MNPLREKVLSPEDGDAVALVPDEPRPYGEVEAAVDEEPDAAGDDGWLGEGHA